jgi:hypothetical protein
MELPTQHFNYIPPSRATVRVYSHVFSLFILQMSRLRPDKGLKKWDENVYQPNLKAVT